VLLTALPASLRQLAATNIPAVSSILWHEFLDNNKPDWFTALPSNIQSYLIVQYGPSTAWPTSTPTSSASSTMSTVVSSAADAASSTSEPDSPSASNSGLSQGAKIGIGIGVPLGVLALLAVCIPCCWTMRKKKQKKPSGYEPPPTPGFMPHGAFQEKSASYQEYRRPLNREQSWDQNDELWMQPVADDVPHPPRQDASHGSMGNSTTIVGPPLLHTHSSNRARGKRTSHNSLHSVAEVTEPDEEYAAHSHGRRLLRRSSMPLRPQVAPPVPVGSSIRRKPIAAVEPHPQIESPLASPVAERGSFGHFSLLRPAMLHQDRSGSSSSGLNAASISSIEDSRRSSANTAPTETDPVSPIAPPEHKSVNPFTTTSNEYTPNNRTSNPFTNDHAYVEDYGPEYQNQEYQNGYVDVEDGLYGGHRSLDAYPVVPEKSERRSSKSGSQWPLTDWPLKSLGSMGRGRRERSPQWDRVYQ
jgi:hypothetical protein